jgi:hypothetical protein
MAGSARARELRVLRRLPRWLRAPGQDPTGAVSDALESGTWSFDSDCFRGRINASLGRAGRKPEGESEMLSRWT